MLSALVICCISLLTLLTNSSLIWNHTVLTRTFQGILPDYDHISRQHLYEIGAL